MVSALQALSPMAKRKVARVTELPPGKGKTIEVEGRQLVVFNVDGRLRATVAHLPPRRRAGDAAESTCPQSGGAFDVFAEDSPANLRADDEELPLAIEDGAVVVDI